MGYRGYPNYDIFCEARRIERSITYYGKPMTKQKILEIMKVLNFSGEVQTGYIPDDVMKVIMPGFDDPLEARLEFALRHAIKAGDLTTDPQNPNLIIPCNS